MIYIAIHFAAVSAKISWMWSTIYNYNLICFKFYLRINYGKDMTLNDFSSFHIQDGCRGWDDHWSCALEHFVSFFKRTLSM